MSRYPILHRGFDDREAVLWELKETLRRRHDRDYEEDRVLYKRYVQEYSFVNLLLGRKSRRVK